MDISGFLWLEDIVKKLADKHNVQTQEVEEVFVNIPYFRFAEKGHPEGENVYSALGKTNAGRYVVVFFVYKAGRLALVLSARDMTSAERRVYGRR